MSSQQHHGMDNSGHPASYYLPKSSNPLVLDSQGKIYEGLQNRGQFIEVQKKNCCHIFFYDQLFVGTTTTWGGQRCWLKKFQNNSSLLFLPQIVLHAVGLHPTSMY